jgi:hypothetical protein
MRFALALIAPLPLACGGSGGICTSPDLAAALSRARMGDVVTMGSCKITGAFTVPSGVTLKGAGPLASFIAVPAGARGLSLQTLGTTRVEDLAILGGGAIGIYSSGDGVGAIAISNVVVTATRGVGIGIERVASAALTDVKLSGTASDMNVAGLSGDIGPADAPTHGIVLSKVGAATLARVESDAFARFGVLAVSSPLTWSTGGAMHNLGVGLFVQGSTAMLDSIDLSGTLRGTSLDLLGYSAAFTGGSTIATSHLVVSNSEGYGLVHDGGSVGMHADLIAANNHGIAVFAQHGSTIDVSGALSDNGRGGIFAIGAHRVSVHDATIARTHLGIQIDGDRSVMIGDGIQVVGGADNVQVKSVTLDENERVGALFDLGGGRITASALSDVHVTTSSAAFGVIAENGAKTTDWDSGVMRAGGAAANDRTFSGSLDTVRAVGPCYMPAPDVVLRGLSALVGP